MISEEQVKHVAKLARLNLTDEEVKTFAGQFEEIFGYIEILDEIDTSDVKETSQVTGLENVTESDEVTRKCSGDDLIACSPLPKERKQIRVKPAIKK